MLKIVPHSFYFHPSVIRGTFIWLPIAKVMFVLTLETRPAQEKWKETLSFVLLNSQVNTTEIWVESFV